MENSNTQVAKASITTLKEKGFLKISLHTKISKHKNHINGLGLMILILILSFFTTSAQQSLKGGTQRVPLKFTPPKNEGKVRLKNDTGHDMWDLRITSLKGDIKECTANGANGLLYTKRPNPSVPILHIKFAKPVNSTPPNTLIDLDLIFTATIADSVEITPTDSIGSDLMVNRSIPANEKGNTKTVIPEATPLDGGETTVTFDESNFVSLDYINKTDQPVCDLNIYSLKNAANQNVNINEIWVNNKRLLKGKNQASAHVEFPCIQPGGTLKVTVKTAGGFVIVKYKSSPTDTLHHDIVESIKKLGNHNMIDSKMCVATKIDFSSGFLTTKPSVSLVNTTGQLISGFIINSTKTIKKIMINNNLWSTVPSNIHNNTLQIFSGTNEGIALESNFTIDILLNNALDQIGYFNIIPLNANGQIIIKPIVNSGSSAFLFPNQNSTFGAAGRSGSLVAINESCSPISQLVFTSPDQGVVVSSASSPFPSTYDTTTHILTFTPAIPSGDTLKFDFTFNKLLPYSPTDSFPYTTIEFFAPGSLPFDGNWWITQPSCSTASNGAIDFTVTQGVGPFTYLWSDGTTNEDLENVTAGTYTITVSTPTGCMLKHFDVTALQPQLMLFPIDPFCNGSNTGSVATQLTGYSGSLNYLWSNSTTSSTNTNLNAGTHTLTLTALDGCTWSGTVTLTAPAPLILAGTITNLNCNKDASGAIALTASGGTGYYNFNWSDGKTIEDRIGLKAKTYTVTVNDAFGCTTTISFKVKEPKLLLSTLTITDAPCFGGYGTGTATVTGGTVPYAFQWSNGATLNTNANLSVGPNSLMVTDAHGCQHGTTLLINQPMQLMVNVFPTGADQAMAQVNGGIPPYQFNWNTIPMQTTPMAIGLQPGQLYILQVMDANNCMQQVHFTMPNMRLGEGNQNAISIYPNPTSQLLNISVSNAADEKMDFSLFDIMGKKVFAKQLVSASGTVVLDLGEQPNGVYSLKIVTGNENVLSKVVIQH